MVNTLEMPETAHTVHEPAPIAEAPRLGMIEIEQLDFAYGSHQVLHEVNLSIPPRAVTAFIGPSGCGKTTLLRCLNRMNDLIDGARITRGSIRIESMDINDPGVDVVDLGGPFVLTG